MKTVGYELMQTRMQILKGIAKGEQAIKDDRVMTHEEVKESFSKCLDVGTTKKAHRNN